MDKPVLKVAPASDSKVFKVSAEFAVNRWRRTHGFAENAGFDVPLVYPRINVYKLESELSSMPYSHSYCKSGIALEMPKGVHAQFAPRSGKMMKEGMLVGPGVIDSSYRGEVLGLCYRTHAHPLPLLHLKVDNLVERLTIDLKYGTTPEQINVISYYKVAGSNFDRIFSIARESTISKVLIGYLNYLSDFVEAVYPLYGWNSSSVLFQIDKLISFLDKQENDGWVKTPQKQETFAQLVFYAYAPVNISEMDVQLVDSLDKNTVRGDKGFGSTGG